MKAPPGFALPVVRSWLVLTVLAPPLNAQEPPAFTAIEALTNRELALTLTGTTGLLYRIEAAPQLSAWSSLVTVAGASSIRQTDSAAPFLEQRFYRALQLTGSNLLTGDHLATTNGDVVIHPINHATFVLGWNGLMIYNDPVGGAARFTGLARADLVLLSHTHTDHFDVPTLNGVILTNAVLIAPSSVYQSLPVGLRNLTTILTNGASTTVLGLTIEAVPAYNLTSSFHPKGQGNGYVLTIGGRRIYISGDTEDVPEMRALPDVDVAFLAMNQPYTMTVAKAVSAVRAFRPHVVYPYHSQGNPVTDLGAFKRQVMTDPGVEVRLRKWY